jgi:hypothetical protein
MLPRLDVLREQTLRPVIRVMAAPMMNKPIALTIRLRMMAVVPLQRR